MTVWIFRGGGVGAPGHPSRSTDKRDVQDIKLHACNCAGHHLNIRWILEKYYNKPKPTMKGVCGNIPLHLLYVYVYSEDHKAMFIINNILADSFSCRLMFTLCVKGGDIHFFSATPPHPPQIFFLNEGLHLFFFKVFSYFMRSAHSLQICAWLVVIWILSKETWH